MKARLVWPPHPYKAGFCITDDTDAATFEQVRAVYNFLRSKGFRTTKTVWPFKPADRCGIPPLPDSAVRGITLEDGRYLDYCKKLHERGYEICLHGASAGNNTREHMLKALDFLERHIGPADTFICHAKNADNLYWEHKITSLPVFRGLLKLHSRHSCSGEVESSPFFWGDLCREKINQVRLLRTRCTDTLKRNPSMPYFDPRKPYVNGWFSATKRHIADCATPQALERLKRNYGLTVLYQYLFRYAHPGTLELDGRFTGAICDIVADREVLVDTVSHLMARLRLMQGLFVLYEGRHLRLVNTNNQDVPEVQIALPRRLSGVSSDCPTVIHDDGLVLPVVPASAILTVETAEPLQFEGRRCRRVGRHKRIAWPMPFGTLFVNLCDSPWQIDADLKVGPNSFSRLLHPGADERAALARLPIWEEVRLMTGQMWILAREILFKGRSPNLNTYLDDTKEIKLEDHNNW